VLGRSKQASVEGVLALYEAMPSLKAQWQRVPWRASFRQSLENGRPRRA